MTPGGSVRLLPARNAASRNFRPRSRTIIHPPSCPSAAKDAAPSFRLADSLSEVVSLTNDTAFAHHVTNPESGVRKTYRVKLSGLIDDATIAQLAEGVRMKRGDEARPVSVHRLEDRGKYTWLEVVLTEGKNREVRRMVEAVGFKVLKLVRTAIGPLTLEGLEVGRWRVISVQELTALRLSRCFT